LPEASKSGTESIVKEDDVDVSGDRCAVTRDKDDVDEGAGFLRGLPRGTGVVMHLPKLEFIP
jgi:hypothetical protein